MIKFFDNRFQLYVFFYHILILLFLINSKIFRKELIIPYLFLIYLFEWKQTTKGVRYLVFFGLLSALSGFCFFVRQYYANSTLVVYFFFLFIIVQLYNEQRIGTKIHAYLISIYTLFVLFKLAMGVDPNFILMDRSRNMVSLYLLLYVILYYIEDYRYNQQIRLWPALLVTFISLLMIGRSGILVSGLLLSGVVSFKFWNSSVLGKFKYLFVIGAVVSLIWLFLGDYLFIFFDDAFVRFEERGVDLTGRNLIYEKYMQLLNESFTNIIFGVRLDYQEFKLFDLNLHNSFFSLHYFLGIGSLIVLFYLLKMFIIGKREHLFILFLVSVLLIRGFTDQIFFFNFNDIVIFYPMFYILNTKNTHLYETSSNKLRSQ